MDDLPLRHHDLQGRPAATLARVIARIDRCKDELVTSDALTAWAAALPDTDARAPREREFAALYATHDRMLAEQGLIDHGELVLRAHALLAERPHVRARRASAAPWDGARTAIASGGAPWSTRAAKRATSAVVLPLPAPPSTSSAPPRWATACCWASVSPPGGAATSS
jgi:hypothetical protein